MVDVALVQSASNNGTTSPATPSSITATAGNLLILAITARGTSPTVGTPTNWTVVRAVNGSTVSLGLFMLANNAGGAFNPSSTLGGTVAGWTAAILEFNQCGSNCGLQGSAILQPAANTVVTDIFASQVGQMQPQLLFVYMIGRATNVFTPNFGGLGPSGTSGWSSSIQAQVGVQGISQDVYWGTNLAIGAGPWPTAPGTLASSAVYKAASAWFNTIGSNSSIGSPIGGTSGIYVPPQYQGMTGG